MKTIDRENKLFQQLEQSQRNQACYVLIIVGVSFNLLCLAYMVQL